SLQIDPNTAGRLFVGSDDGVYVTADDGNNWSRFGTGLPNAQVFQIELNTSLSILAAGTHGRGMWEISVSPASSLAINSVTPQAGRTSGGQQIVLRGAFQGLSTVTVGGASASWFYTNGSGDTTQITVTTPAHAVGAVQIDVTPTTGSAYS